VVGSQISIAHHDLAKTAEDKDDHNCVA
jgi:hypothetical protein